MAFFYSMWNSTATSISQILPGDRTPDNRNSPFLAKLNPDIRIMIYKSVLAPLGYGCGGVHLEMRRASPAEGNDRKRKMASSTDNQLYGWRCITLERNRMSTYRLDCSFIRMEHTPREEMKRRIKRTWLGWQVPKSRYTYLVLGLLLSCRDIYSEAAPVFYQNNIFTFAKPEALFTLQQTIPTSRFRSIRFLHLSTALAARWDPTNQTAIAPEAQCDPDFKQFAVSVLTQWTSVWRIIADEMEGLQNLRVSLSSLVTPDAPRNVDEETLLHVFRPMMKIHVPTFQVVVAWIGGRFDAFFGDVLGRVLRVLELETGQSAPFQAKEVLPIIDVCGIPCSDMLTIISR